MKVYFTVTPKAIVDHKYKLYEIYDLIEELGYKHVTDFVKTVNPKEFYDLDRDKIAKNYARFIGYIKAADIVVFDVTVQSMGVGQKLSYALSIGKPTVCLYEKGYAPFLLSGIDDPKLVLAEYDSTNKKEVIQDAIEEAVARADVRFNFFISPEIGAYLNWVAKHRRVPRAVFLRGLLEREMEADEEYQQDSGATD